MQLATSGKGLDRRELPAVGLDGKDGAGFNRDAVQEDDTGAAVRRIAANVGARQTQSFADEMHQQQSGLDIGGDHFSIDREADRSSHC